VKVTLTRGFWIGKYELTVRESTRHSRKAIATHKNHPLESVHWDNLRNFLKLLNKAERDAGRLTDGWEYALPSEAEWEYAARAGTKTPFYFGNDIAKLPQHANFADRSLYDTADSFYVYADRKLNDGAPRLARVGSYKPNPWGLHDIYGNVWEWCATRYSAKPVGGIDPFPIDRKKYGGPVARGGSWVSRPDYCRSAFRHRFGNRNEASFLGCRIVLRKKR